jgi:predicted outer membrane repeat protein
VTTRLHTAAAFATAGILAAGLGLISSPAHAGDPAPRRTTAPQHPTPLGQKRLSPAQLAAVRERQRTMLAQPAPAPTLARAAAGTPVLKLTVDTTEDSDLADPAGTRCIDAATGGCSLRAAVDAANNRRTPVQITLGKHAYTLSSATELTVTNPAGTSIVGAGAGAGPTSIHGTPSSGIFVEQQAGGGPAPLLYVTGLRVTGGTADIGGGAFDLEESVDNGATGPTLVLDHVKAVGNTATFLGGALYAAGDATVYASRSSFTGNAAQTGGALYTYRSNINLTAVTVTENHASQGGGGWDTQYSVDRMRGGSISGNSAAAGGGLYDLWGHITLSDVHVDHNIAVDDDDSASNSAGGIYAYSDLLEVDAGTISHNRATGDHAMGGGIEVEGSEATFHGVTMAGDRVSSSVTEPFGGGAMFLEGDGLPFQVTIDQGSKITGANGSAVYVNATNGAVDLEINGSRLSRNSNTSSNGFNGSGCGGALCSLSGVGEAMNLTMNRDTVLANTSTGGFGAISVVGDDSATARVHLIRCLFQGNVAGAGGRGGALGIVNVNDSASLSVRTEADTFSNNQAGTSASPGRGGAIDIEGLAAYDDQGSTFVKNRARGDDAYGGAVDSDGLQSTRFVGTTFSRNAAGAPTTGTGHGGAVITDGQSGNTFVRVTMSGNRSAGYGGGLATGDDAFDVSIERSTISGNIAGTSAASGLGGGVYSAQAALVLENSTVTGNRAAQGGGIYSAESTLGLRYSTVTGNVASQGGGVYLFENGGTVLGSILSANHKSGNAEQDCWSTGASSILQSLGGNLLGQKRCVTAVSSTDKVTKHPRLAPLAKNGGPTKTMALAKKSPAIGRGTLQCPATDQRGRQRPAHHCDAGAFELPKVKKHHHPHHQH